MSITPTTTLEKLEDDVLLERVRELANDSRRIEADLIAHLAEVEARGLLARHAVSSTFGYCRKTLNLSESEAYLRITVARASRKHPVLLEMLADGRLHLTGAGKLAPHLTVENREGLLFRATRQSKRRIEELIAELSPQPDVPARIRKLPERAIPQLRPDAVGGQVAPPAPPAPALAPAVATSASVDGAVPLRLVDGAVAVGRVPVLAPVATAPSRPATTAPARISPLSPSRFKVQFTASAELKEKLGRLQELMPRGISGGDLAAVIEAAVTEKLERLEARRYAQTKAPRKTLAETDTSPRSRNIPAAVRRAVYERDGGRCTFVDAQGRRCTERHRLEYHHHGRAWARGGDHSVGNVRLVCFRHHEYLADVEYGRAWMARCRRSGAAVGPAPP
jgi:hypothetical protein